MMLPPVSVLQQCPAFVHACWHVMAGLNVGGVGDGVGGVGDGVGDGVGGVGDGVGGGVGGAGVGGTGVGAGVGTFGVGTFEHSGVALGFQKQLARVQCVLSEHSKHNAPEAHDGLQLWPLLPSASGPSPFWHLVVEVGYQKHCPSA
jgi:hypothetical protein